MILLQSNTACLHTLQHKINTNILIDKHILTEYTNGNEHIDKYKYITRYKYFT